MKITSHALSRTLVGCIVLCALSFWSGCATEPAVDPAVEEVAAELTAADLTTAELAAAEASAELDPLDDHATSALRHHYCCQITVIEDSAPIQCFGFHTYKAWARTKCYAIAGTIPGALIPVLASGRCSEYFQCR